MVDEIKNVNSVNINGNQNIDFAAGQTAGNKVSIFEEMLKKYEAQLGRPLTPEEVAIMMKAIEQGTAFSIADVFGASFATHEPIQNEPGILAQDVAVAEQTATEPDAGLIEPVNIESPKQVLTEQNITLNPEGVPTELFTEIPPNLGELTEPQGAAEECEEDDFDFVNSSEHTVENINNSLSADEDDCYSEYINSKQLEKITDIKQKRHILAEYRARNEFIFEGGERKPASAWDKLSKEDKAARIEKYEKEEYSSRLILDECITEIDAATNNGFSVSEFREICNKEQQLALKTLTLQIKEEQLQEALKSNTLQTNGEEPVPTGVLTKKEKAFLERQNTKLEAIKAKAKKEGIPEDEIDYFTMNDFIKSQNGKPPKVNFVEAMVEYLESIPENERTEEDNQVLASFKEKVESADPGTVAIRYAQASMLENEYKAYMETNPEKLAEYEKLDPLGQNKAKTDWLSEQIKAGKINKENIEQYFNDALEVWDVGELRTLETIINNYDEFQEACANSDKGSLRSFFQKNMKLLGKHQQVAASNYLTNAEKTGNTEIYDATANNVYESASGKDKLRIFEQINTNCMSYDGINTLSFHMVKHISEAKTEKEANELAEEYVVCTKNKSSEFQKRTLDNLGGCNYPSAQGVIYSIVDGNAELAEYSVANKIVPKLDESIQVASFEITQNTLEECLPEEEAKEQLRLLGDQVELLDVSAQLGAHNSLTNSRYGEIAAYAAGNISHYDKSVQAEAYSVSYQVAVNTNNPAMMDALNGQYSQLSPEAQAAIASNPKYAASLSASAARAMAAEDDTLRDDFSIQSNAAFDNVKTHKEIFMELWDKLTPAQKYNVICDMSVRNFSKMSPSIRKKILEHAKNDPLFLHRLVEKFGMDLLKNELFPDALAVIVRDLLRDPSQRRIVAKEVFNNPSRYPAQLVEDCQDILRDYADNIRPEVFNRLSRTEKVEALKNPDDFEVPEDIDYGEDLTYAPSQSGSNRRNKLEYDKWNSLKTIANFYRIS